MFNMPYQPMNIEIAITPDGVVLMVPPTITINDEEQLEMFLEMIRDGVSEGLSYGHQHSHQETGEALMSYDEFEDIISDIDEEWRQKIENRQKRSL